MSKENILRVHLKPIEHNDLKPNVAELTELLSEKDFWPLIDASSDNLPVGSVVVFYNCKNNTFFFGVIYEHTHYGFSYIPFGELNNFNPDGPDDMENLSRKHEFKDLLYKVLMQLPVVSGELQLEHIPKAVAESGFRPLDKATSEDLPEGCLAFLYVNSGAVFPVIVRELSNQWIDDRRFLYWSQSPISVGDWRDGVIMDRLKKFKNYSYLVVS